MRAVYTNFNLHLSKIPNKKRKNKNSLGSHSEKHSDISNTLQFSLCRRILGLLSYNNMIP